MRERWFERLHSTIADRGRELLGLSTVGRDTDKQLLQKLLAGRGEASAIAIAREILDRYANKDAQEKESFFVLLEHDFGPQPELIEPAVARYLQTRDQMDFVTLAEAVEPPRQEVFRRLNMAPHGTKALVEMREDLLHAIRKNASLRVVDADFKHLLSSWFNRGFLNLRRIDWSSPAQVLEKLINYESVHEIKGWKDLRRRLENDRRCFAFFHPALPDEPVIFVEVALTDGMSDDVAPLLDIQSPVADPFSATTAVFYSINNTLVGLRGISFGNFLIKQVLEELKRELPKLKQFVTLSPIPRMAQAIDEVLHGRAVEGLGQEKLLVMLSDLMPEIEQITGETGPETALTTFLQRVSVLPQDKTRPVLERLVLIYLTQSKYKDSVYDSVAAFHLANGAILERINPFANVTEYGLHASYGCMVNYLYDPDQVEANHEQFVNSGVIAMSKALAREAQRIANLVH